MKSSKYLLIILAPIYLTLAVNSTAQTPATPTSSSASADVNATDKDGKTALIRAAADGDLDKVKALIAAGANVKAKANDGKTALIVQLECAHKDGVIPVDSVKALIAAGADVDAKDKDGWTALIMVANAYVSMNMGEKADDSAAARWVDCAKALIAAKANVNASANNGQTALDLAEAVNQIRAVRGYAPIHPDMASILQSAGSMIILHSQ